MDFNYKDGKLRGLAYIAIGKFARRIPNVISNDITLVHNFFNALALVRDQLLKHFSILNSFMFYRKI